jgi:uncharacterized delta-60 repeat protein
MERIILSLATVRRFALGKWITRLGASVCIAIATSSAAAPVQLDTAFGVNGVASLGAGPADEYISSMALQADGKLLALSICEPGVCLLRFGTDGALDATFNSKGWVTLPGSYIPEYAARPEGGVLAQPDGKALVAMRCKASPSAFCVLRYNADGSADLTFNGTGAAQHVATQSLSAGTPAVLQPDGKIVVAGVCGSTPCAVRFTGAGVLDSSFGTGGEFQAPAGFGLLAYDLGINADGSLTLLTACSSAAPMLCLMRISPSGVLDETFASAGKLTLPVQLDQSGGSDFATLAIQPDGKMLIAGYCDIGRCAMRLTIDGVPDASFGTAGKVQLGNLPGVTGFFGQQGMSLQSDGKLLVAANCAAFGEVLFPCVLRLNANGSLDASYGNAGLAVAPMRSNYGFTLVVPQADGKLYIGTTCERDLTASRNRDICVARLTQSGVLDSAFGADGIARPLIARKGGRAESLVLLPDGKIVVGGHCEPEISRNGLDISDTCFARFTPQGTPDLSLEGRGWKQLDMGFAYSRSAFAPHTNGKLIIALFCSPSINESLQLCMVRLNQDGTFDASFADAGKLFLLVPGAQPRHQPALLIQDDGKIVVATECRESNESMSVCVVRLLADGSADATFNSGNVVRIGTSLDGLQYSSAAALGGLAVQADGKLVITATCPATPNSTLLCFLRLLANGAPDTSFGSAGKVVITEPNSVIASGLAIQSDGKLLATAWCDLYGCLFRLNADGTSDTSFNGTGRVMNGLGRWHAPTVQADGSIVTAGSCDDSGCIARWNADGSIDASFNDGSPVSVPAYSAYSLALAFQPDGKLLATSWSTSLAVLRFLPLPAPVPPSIAFVPQTGVALSTTIVSNAVTPSGLSAVTPISVNGGEYSLGCTATFVSTQGTIEPGQSVCVRHTSAAQAYTSAITTLTVGTASGQFISTTGAFALVTIQKQGTGSGSVTSSPSGIACGADCTEMVALGSTITLTAVPDAGNGFLRWGEANCAEGYDSPTCTIAMTHNTTINPVFRPLVTLTVTKTGTGTGRVVSSAAGIDCGSACTAIVTDGSYRPFTAIPDPGFAVAGWSEWACEKKNICETSIFGNKTVSVQFEPGVRLTIDKSGPGTVRLFSFVAEFNCASQCNSWFLHGTYVHLYANPDPGAVFVGWFGGGCSGTGTCTVQLESAKTVSAIFATQGQAYQVSVTRSGSGTGTVTSTPAGISCGGTCSGEFAPGTTVSLTASASGPSVFLGWFGAGCSGTGDCIVAVRDGNISVEAKFVDSAVPATKGDIDGDGRSDLVWYNTSSGFVYGIQMNGLVLGRSGVLDYETNLSWKVAAVVDLNGDRTADFVWHNQSTGQVFAVLLNGFNSIGELLVYREPNTQWKIAGAGDFNGDGRADLLWHNSVSGEVFLLLMNGLSVIGGGVVYSEPNTSWQIQKVADFNGDGRADVLWRNVATGDVFVLLMNGTTVTDGGVIYSEPNTAWQIQAAADFNGDGRADVLWRNTTTGDVFMMLMNGTTITGGSVFYGEPNADWKIVATGDYNGDGRADILWRNTATGQVFMMLMDGFTISGGGFVYTEPDQSWRILGP